MYGIVDTDEINDVEMAEFEKKFNLPASHWTQVELIADMIELADVIYGRIKII